jgi:DNA-binding CsgD family transcriptional regulator
MNKAERRLTARQREVVRLVGEGLSNKQIAGRMDISENGVKRHLASLFAKYGVESRAALVHHAAANLGEVSEEVKLFQLLRATLADVLGQPATDVLLRRAAGRERRLPGEAREGEEASVPLAELMDHLWQLLFDMTGDVVLRKLEHVGFAGGGEGPRARVRP